MKEIRGVLHGHCETGTEGTMPAIQKHEHISGDGTRWSYEGLEIIDPGDHLIVIKDDEVVLDVVIEAITGWGCDDTFVLADEPDLIAKWERYPMNPQHGQLHINGFWVHYLPTNVDLRLWWDIFFANSCQYDGILRKKKQ